MKKIACHLCKKARWTRRRDENYHLCKPCRKKRGFETDQPKQTVPYKRGKKVAPVVQKQEKKQKKGRFER